MSAPAGADSPRTLPDAAEASRFLAALVASSQEAIIGFTLDGVILSWNAGAEKLYGYTQAEAVGQDVAFLTPAECSGEIPDIFGRLAQGQTIERYRTERLRKDGTRVHASISFSLVRDAAGAMLGASAIHRDVGELVRVETVRQRVAAGATLPHGEAFFEALTRYLIDSLDVDYAFVSAIAEADLRALAFADRERNHAMLILPLAGSPCEGAMRHGRLTVASGLPAAFPAYRTIDPLDLESYAGVALHDDTGVPMGVVAVAGTAPFRDPEFVVALLDLVAPRAEVELRQRRARLALAESEERYRRLIELSPDMVMVHAGGRFVFANATAARMLAAPGPEALIGRPVGDVSPLPYADVTACCAANYPCRGSGPLATPMLRRLDGKLLDVTAAAAPITFEGRPACMVVYRDVTEQKRTAASLSEAQRIARIGSFEWNLMTDTHWWSDELYRLLGLRPGAEAPTLARFLAAIDPFDRPAVEAALTGARRDHRPFRLDFMVLDHEDGACRLEGRGHIVTDGKGVPLRLIGTAQDVSEARRAALALQASEARFRSVVATAGEGIVLGNQDGEIILWNPGAASIFGYDMTETLGRPLTMLMPERFRQAHTRALAAAARRGHPIHRKPVEFVGLHKDGTEFPLELSLTSWESDGERYFTGLVRDISDRRAIERMKDTFIATISHELRTPLNTITCSLDLLSSGALGLGSEKAARILEIAQSNTDRLARIVSDILDLQVLDQGRVPIMREPCDLAAVVREAVQTTAPMAERREVAVEKALTLPPEFSLRADAGRLHQTLVNLLVNAIRYAPPGSRIVVSASAGATEVRLAVDDEGPGIPPEQRELVFERFYQAAPPSEGQAPGTGLGLAICRAIVQQHGGRIWIEDGPRGGAAFVLTLPTRP